MVITHVYGYGKYAMTKNVTFIIYYHSYDTQIIYDRSDDPKRKTLPGVDMWERGNSQMCSDVRQTPS